VVAETFFVRVCDLNAIETIPLWIECMSERSNETCRCCGRAAATADREWRNRDTDKEQSETIEGKMLAAVGAALHRDPAGAS
jgi:hypothetical protein